MANLQANGLRRGTTIIYDGIPFRVLSFEHRTPGNKRAFVQTKLRNLLDGTQREVKFSSTEVLERAIVETREMEFLYTDSVGCVFMDSETYDQLTIPKQDLANSLNWLSEGMRIFVELLDGNPIGVELPKLVEMAVAQTEPVVRGQTASRSSKPATLENGTTVQVPPFIEAGDRIRVDPSEERYVDRVK